MRSYPVIYQSGEAQIIEKKSRFLARVFGIHSLKDVSYGLEQSKKQYFDASHHCYAYIFGETNPLQKFSDDKEPAGTAGRPILTVLDKKNLRNTCLIVVRYFGGVLLGSGGLVRAYTKAAQAAIEDSQIVWRIPAKRYTLLADYSMIGKLSYLFSRLDLVQLDTTFEQKVSYTLLLPVDKEEQLKKELLRQNHSGIELIGGQVVFYGMWKNQVVLLPDGEVSSTEST
ncbi:YigZ family protein [Clostridia bacterium]|nr:YigZ family protein [Clostridia bacterium]